MFLVCCHQINVEKRTFPPLNLFMTFQTALRYLTSQKILIKLHKCVHNEMLKG